MPPHRRAPSAASARRTILELGVLGAFVLVLVLVVLPLAVTWANGVHLQFPGGSSGGQPSGTPLVSLAGGQPSATPVGSPAGGPGRVYGIITAGPVCPVERSPADPKCAPRPVAGAVVVAKDATGDELGRATSQADGSYALPLSVKGTVVITALPVAGLVGVPPPVSLTFADQDDVQQLNLAYDTGIR
jgi:hypothetical protein